VLDLNFKESFLIIFIALFAVSACEKNTKEVDYVARIGESTLTKEEIQKELSLFSSHHTRSQLAHEIIQKWAQRELLFLEAVDKGLAKDQDLKLRVDTYRKSLYGNAYVDMYLSNKIFVNTDEVREHYRNNREVFRRDRPEARLVHFILPSQEEASEVKRSLLKYDEETRQNFLASYHVDVKTVMQGDLIPELDQIIFSSKQPQGILGPVKTSYGFHVFKVFEFYPKDSFRGLDEVYDEISQQIFRLKSELLYIQLIDSLKTIHTLEINPDFSFE